MTSAEMLQAFLERALAAPPHLSRRDYFAGQALAGLAAKLPVSEDEKFAARMLPRLATLAVTLANETDLLLEVLEEREARTAQEMEEEDYEQA